MHLCMISNLYSSYLRQPRAGVTGITIGHMLLLCVGRSDLCAPPHSQSPACFQLQVFHYCTFMDGNDVGVVEWRHDLNLPPYVQQILLIFDFVFPDGLDGHLGTEDAGD